MTVLSPVNDKVRLLGRMDGLCMDWTGSGFEVRLLGPSLWVELENTSETAVIFAAGLVDGYPVTRFPVEFGKRWYAVAMGMSAGTEHTISLVRETQLMGGDHGATVILHQIKFEGELRELPEPSLRIEFVGDSLTSAEGSLAPCGNQEWIAQWFSACANYSHYACRELGAERRVLSQSGWGLCWNYLGERKGNMAGIYEQVAGPLKREGCQAAYDFSSWKADVVCVRLMSNDVGGMRRMDKVEELKDELVDGAVAFIRKVRKCNPEAHIVWIAPASNSMPELAVKAVETCIAQGMERVSHFIMPDYADDPANLGARNHPNAAYNERAGHLLAEYLRNLTK